MSGGNGDHDRKGRAPDDVSTPAGQSRSKRPRNTTIGSLLVSDADAKTAVLYILN